MKGCDWPDLEPTARPHCDRASFGWKLSRGLHARRERRAELSGRGIATAIARRGDSHGSGFGVLRYVVEQTVALLHQFRRLRTRFDRRADVHEAFMKIGCAMICWRRLHRLTGFF